MSRDRDATGVRPRKIPTMRKGAAMSDRTLSKAEIESRLQEVAALLRQSSSLDSATRQHLAELVEELGASLHAVELPSEEAARIADTTAHLADALHQNHDAEQVGHARGVMEQTAEAIEARAPMAADLVRRFLAALTGIGI